MKIEKGVPYNPNGLGPRGKYPFHGLEVGDSFWVGLDVSQQSAVSGAAFQHGSRHGKVFRTQREGDGTRVWRIA